MIRLLGKSAARHPHCSPLPVLEDRLQCAEDEARAALRDVGTLRREVVLLGKNPAGLSDAAVSNAVQDAISRSALVDYDTHRILHDQVLKLTSVHANLGLNSASTHRSLLAGVPDDAVTDMLARAGMHTIIAREVAEQMKSMPRAPPASRLPPLPAFPMARGMSSGDAPPSSPLATTADMAGPYFDVVFTPFLGVIKDTRAAAQELIARAKLAPEALVSTRAFRIDNDRSELSIRVHTQWQADGLLATYANPMPELDGLRAYRPNRVHSAPLTTEQKLSGSKGNKVAGRSGNQGGRGGPHR
ncbi:hypothetical protein HDZ31DRAFT_69937 [Schizophyllum fasciatum]